MTMVIIIFHQVTVHLTVLVVYIICH